ncbi:DVU_1556 family methyltransferase [Desulfovibrio falkowii]|uniref:DVU_1556 family methyltransferase n=1 Tax=Desulfovibrio sp. WGS1351 TaxID=3366814 RepID=UPI00372D7210
MRALWESENFRRATGHAWRPGGLDLTARGLILCRELCGLSPGHLVLDLGCGPGGTVRLLQQSGYDVLGLDRQVNHAAACKNALAQASENGQDGWRFAQADIARLPLADACVQGLVCECVLSLLPDPVQALHGCLRVLRPGGVLLFSDLTRRDEGACVASVEEPAAADRCARGAFLSGPGGSGKVSVSLGMPASSGVSGSSVSCDAYGAYGKSCMDGARSVLLWNAYLGEAGFHVVRYEDHSRALVELAARMLWYGGDEAACMPDSGIGAGGADDVASASFPRSAASVSSAGCACSFSGNGRKFGYGLWIAQKEQA